jgi:hypothetical protein
VHGSAARLEDVHVVRAAGTCASAHPRSAGIKRFWLVMARYYAANWLQGRSISG